MFQVMKEFKFDAAHRLVKGYVGKCNSLHGHTWTVRVFIEADALDRFDMALDFNHFKPLKMWIDDHLDHATILCYDDPLYGALLAYQLTESQRLWCTAGRNPTSETIAQLLWHTVNDLIVKPHSLVNPTFRCTRVEVDETCTSKAVYIP